MKSIEKVTSIIVQQGMLPLYFNADETVSIKILRAIYKAGIKVVEYTNRSEAALNNFRKMVEVRNAEMPNLLLGTGTIKNITQAKEFLRVGADFLISPGFVSEVATYCLSNQILYIPGCMTPTDIIVAENAGVRFIKLFPGNMLGAEFLTSIKDIFPEILFMPTGGVDTSKKNLEDWFGAGVCAVGMGSKLIRKQIFREEEYDELAVEIKKVLESIQLVRENF